MKKMFVFLLTLLIFIFIFYLITYLESLKGSKSKTMDAPPTTSPPVLYDKISSDKLLEIVATRQTLSARDTTARLKIIEKVSSESGVIWSDTDLSIEYVKNADSFMVELKSLDVDFSKQKAINYLRGEGFSDDGICKLPLVFYLNPQTAKEYGKKETFSSIPDFCL